MPSFTPHKQKRKTKRPSILMFLVISAVLIVTYNIMRSFPVNPSGVYESSKSFLTPDKVSKSIQATIAPSSETNFIATNTVAQPASENTQQHQEKQQHKEEEIELEVEEEKEEQEQEEQKEDEEASTTLTSPDSNTKIKTTPRPTCEPPRARMSEPEIRTVYITVTPPPTIPESILPSNMDARVVCGDRSDKIQGEVDPGALITVIVTPMMLPPGSEGSDKEMRLRHTFFSWKHTPGMTVIVMSGHCPLLMLAREYGLPTFRGSSGSDVEDMTIRHMLIKANEIAVTPLIGYMNSDIVFDSTEVMETLKAAIAEGKSAKKAVTLIGRRFNSNVPSSLFAQTNEPVTAEKWEKIFEFMKLNNEAFIDAAQDYFFISRNSPMDFSALPPYFVGGVAYDNYLARQFYMMNRARKSIHIDVSGTLKALHIDHGSNAKASHDGINSKFNLKTWGKGSLGMGMNSNAQHESIRDAGGKVVINARTAKQLRGDGKRWW